MSNRNRNRNGERIPVILDLETGDPDDLFTLLPAAAHPQVLLLAVTITPGSEDQVVLVKYILECVAKSKHIPIGAQEWPKHQKKKRCVDLEKWAAILHPQQSSQKGEYIQQDTKVSKKKSKKGRKEWSCDTVIKPPGQISEWGIRPAAELIVDMCRDHPEATLLTCGPTHNLGAAVGAGARIYRWVAQGGFCGANFASDGSEVIPKFAGLSHVASWNFGGSRDATLAALQANQETISRRVLVGKNVCHACIYDEYFDIRMKEFLAENANDGRKKAKASSKTHQYLQALQWLDHILTEKYQNSGSITNRKALHDLLALATMIEESVYELVEVAVDVTEDNRWGAVPATETGETEGSTRTFAAIGFDRAAFVDSLLVV